MFILRSEDNPSIFTHTTNTWDLAQVVKNYIESRHDCTIIIEERKGLVFYDCPGIRAMYKELFYVTIGYIETRVDDVDMLVYYFKLKKDFSRGFTRISSFWQNICLTENEFNETKKYIDENPRVIEGYFNKTEEIYKKNLPK